MRFLSCVAAVSCAILAACSGGSGEYDKYPRDVNVPVPENAANTKLRYLSADLAPYNQRGTVTSIIVTLGPGGQSKPPKDTPQVLADPSLASRVAASLWDGSDSRAAMSLAQQVARSTYCRSGPITPDNGVRRISNPQDISAVLVESQKQGRDVIPAGIKGTSVPAAQFRSDGTNRWVVWLKCDAPFPY